MLAESALELKKHLYSEILDRLKFRQPPAPWVGYSAPRDFQKIERLARESDPSKLGEALRLARQIWQSDIDNLSLRAWVAYLETKNTNSAAETRLQQISKRKDPKLGFTTDWNLAVLVHERKEEQTAYQLLVPLLDHNDADEDLFLVLLALSLKLNDLARFLQIIPRTLSLRFHPLAICVALEAKDELRAKAFLRELLTQWQSGYKLPLADTRFEWGEFEAEIAKAISFGQIDQLVAWLEARVKIQASYVPNYLQLAKVLEDEKNDVPRAFEALRRRLEWARGSKLGPKGFDDACRDLLELCKRNDNAELGQQAYRLAQQSPRAGDDLLGSFNMYSPPGDLRPEPPPPPPHVPLVPVPTGDPKLTERLLSVNARLAEIRSVASYAKESASFEELAALLGKLGPHTSGTAVELVRKISQVIDEFSRTGPDERIKRKALYERAIAFERELCQLLEPNVLPQALADALVPYRQALEKVTGELSRQAGVSPNVQARIENSFLSPEAEASVLALRVINPSERPVTEVQVAVSTSSPGVTLADRRDRLVPKLGPQQSALLSFAIRMGRSAGATEGGEVAFGVSLRASAEGFPNHDLGIVALRAKVQTFRQAIGETNIPKLFQNMALSSSQQDLFKGRADVLDMIGNSFAGGTQRERYFLDGIRRAGKSTIMNFLPSALPKHLLPVVMKMPDFGLSGPVNSASVLHQICDKIWESAGSGGSVPAPPPREDFASAPGSKFNAYLAAFRAAMPGRVPLLMIDEFPLLLRAIARTGTAGERDTVILDLLLAALEEGKLNAVFTGSVRYDRLSKIMDHRIFGSLTRLKVSFLDQVSVSEVLKAGMEKWVKLLPETVKRVSELTGGYPWLVQRYGAELVDLLNRQRRTVATPDDVDQITQDTILANSELFSYWWPAGQLGLQEERFIEMLLTRFSGQQPSKDEFLASVHSREHQALTLALGNLRACEVLDSTHTDRLRFRGEALRLWLERHVHGGKLRIPTTEDEERKDSGHAGVFIDHENVIKTLERVSRQRGVPLPTDQTEWFGRILDHLLAEAERRCGVKPEHRVTVAFWDRPQEKALVSSYTRREFTFREPEQVKDLKNAADFKLADEVRRAAAASVKQQSFLARAFLITGDADFSHAIRGLINDGIKVQIWGGSRETNAEFAKIIGSENVVVLDDVCGL